MAASITTRSSWRRISAAAHRRKLDGRARTATGTRRRTQSTGTWVAAWPIRVLPAAAAMAVTKIHRSLTPGTNWTPVAHITRPSTFSGCCFHSSWATGPPIEYPATIADSTPSSSSSGGHVVGAVGEPEAPPGSQAAAVPAQVGGDHPEVPAERLEHLEPVQAGRGEQAVEEHDGRRPRRAGHLADERRAPAGELDPVAERDGRAGDGGCTDRARTPGHNMTTRQIVRGFSMADHPIHPDIDFISGAFWGRDPHPELTWMRQNAPVYFDGTVWGIASYDGVRAISNDPATFSNAGGIRPDTGPIPMMIDMDDPDHWRRRKLVNRGFTPKRVRASEDRIRAVVRRDHRRGLRARRVRLRVGHRRAAAAHHDRRRARRRARGPRRSPAVERRHAAGAHRRARDR